MKKLIYLSFLLVLISGIYSCEVETELLEIPDSTIQRIVDSAVSAAGTAAANAATNAVNAAFNAEEAAQALANAAPESIDHTGYITSDETWKKESIHYLTDKVIVPDGVILTIEAGTIIKARQHSNPEDSAALIVARGGKIFAIGDSEAPIIFTSELDNIKKDHTYPNGSPNLTAEDYQLWGGLMVMGKARISVDTNEIEFAIEGIPAEDTFRLYGGTDDTDSSGVLDYVSIRHGGEQIGASNEINGLTLGGVGTGTRISNIEIYANFDDGIEFFGGTVDAANLIVWSCGDDGIDTDQSYNGSISNVVVIMNQDPTASRGGDHGLELDGKEGDYAAANPTSASITGFTFKGNAGSEIGQLRDGKRVHISNIYAFNLSVESGEGDLSIETDSNPLDKDHGEDEFVDGFSSLNDIEVVLPSGKTLEDIFPNYNTTHPGFPSSAFTAFKSITTPSSGQGADTSFFSWTLAKTTGVLDF
tara:strand:- start:2839 stop:4263 length:1425 start_codon:yes stop_codon:yes gene_type:complete